MGSTPIFSALGELAQWLEHTTFNCEINLVAKYEGSNVIGSMRISKYYLLIILYFELWFP